MKQATRIGRRGSANCGAANGGGPPHPRLGIPELAGVCTYAEAARPGLAVAENTALLKRYNWLETRLTDLFLTQMNATPEWEVKDAFAHHLWLDAEHAKWLQERVAELRHPPHNFHQPPDERLEAFAQEALRSRGTVETLVAAYRVLKPALLAAYRVHLERTNPLIDQPTRRFLRFMIQEEEDTVAWGEVALHALLVDEAAREQAREWEAHLRAYLAAAGGVSGGEQGSGVRGQGSGGGPGSRHRVSNDELPRTRTSTSRSTSAGEHTAADSTGTPDEVLPGTSRTAGGVATADGADGSTADALRVPRAAAPLSPDWFPRRDARFESFNYHFPPHWVYAQRDRPADERMLALVCKRLLEMDVPEMMAAIIWRIREAALAKGQPKPWAYSAEMCRQVWDVARHSMMGEAWLAHRGIDFTRVPLNVGFSLGLNTLVTPVEAHAALWWIEQGLMPKDTGKAYEFRTASEAGDPLATLYMDYDWADEVLHVHIGRRWLVKELGSREEAERLGAEAFGRVMAIRRHRGLEGAQETEQREWWPQFCESVLGYRPEPLAPEVYETPDQDAPWLRNA